MNKENSNTKRPTFVLNDMVKEKILKMYKISKNDVKKSDSNSKNIS
ncbi:MAG: hypothetical protein ACI4PR_04540 [Acutalibacteraceae bacterium]